jgi:hypothetical protein
MKETEGLIEQEEEGGAEVLTLKERGRVLDNDILDVFKILTNHSHIKKSLL